MAPHAARPSWHRATHVPFRQAPHVPHDCVPPHSCSSVRPRHAQPGESLVATQASPSLQQVTFPHGTWPLEQHWPAPDSPLGRQISPTEQRLLQPHGAKPSCKQVGTEPLSSHLQPREEADGATVLSTAGRNSRS